MIENHGTELSDKTNDMSFVKRQHQHNLAQQQAKQANIEFMRTIILLFVPFVVLLAYYWLNISLIQETWISSVTHDSNKHEQDQINPDSSNIQQAEAISKYSDVSTDDAIFDYFSSFMSSQDELEQTSDLTVLTNLLETATRDPAYVDHTTKIFDLRRMVDTYIELHNKITHPDTPTHERRFLVFPRCTFKTI